MAVLPENTFYAFSRILDYNLLPREGSKMLKDFLLTVPSLFMNKRRRHDSIEWDAGIPVP